MRRSLSTALAAVLIIWTVPARAGDDAVAGAWQQIESDAGACARCRISIDRHGASLTVTANNGWAATLAAGAEDGSVKARGTGSWKSNVTGAMAGRGFNVDFVLQDQRLYMWMRVETGHGSGRTVRAVFGRIWTGV